MLKKYGFITLLILVLCGVRSTLASCSFTTPTDTYINQTMTQSPITAVTLTTSDKQQLFRSTLLAGGPVISTCNPSTGAAIKVSGRNFSSASLSETMPDGGMLLYTGAAGFGYGFWYTVTYGDGSGSYSGHLKQGDMFSATPAQLNGARWEFQAELWYTGGDYSDQAKSSQIPAINWTYFYVGFDNAMRGFFFHSPVIPITPSTCQLSLSSPEADFGVFSSVGKAPPQTVTLSSSQCSMTRKMELRILSNGNPVSSSGTILLNKLTGDDAASGFGVAFYEADDYVRYVLDAALGKGDTYPSDGYTKPGGFISSANYRISMVLKTDDTPIKTGDFETSATLSISYY